MFQHRLISPTKGISNSAKVFHFLEIVRLHDICTKARSPKQKIIKLTNNLVTVPTKKRSLTFDKIAIAQIKIIKLADN